MERVMTEMTSRERVYAAMNHRKPDRVPICFGGTGASGIEECPPNYTACSNLYEYLNLKDADKPLISPVGNIVGNIDEKCMQFLHSDMRSVTDNPPGATVIDRDHKIWPFLYGMRIKKCGIYDMIDFTNPPMANLKTIEDIENYPYWPDINWDTMKGVVEKVRNFHENTDYFICGMQSFGYFPLNGYGFISGMDKWLMDMKLNPKFYHALCEKFMEKNLAFADKFYGGVGKYLDGAMVFDDLGNQAGPLMSIDTYREFYKPYQARIIKHIRQYLRPEAKIILHSCGSMYNFIPDLIEIGVQAINPVQPLAKNMEPWRLKKEFGDKLSFLGGFDVQDLLPLGNVDEIREGAKRLVSEYGIGGGFIFGSSQIIQCNIPPENIVAMFEAAYKYGSYPLDKMDNGIDFVSWIKSLNLEKRRAKLSISF
jgi:uroporphyrinogen decarboxylase